MNHVSVVWGSVRHKAVELDEYTEEDGQIDMVNIDFIHSNAKSPGIIAKLKTSSYKTVQAFHIKQTQAVTGIFFHFTYTKILFSRSTKMLLSQAKSKNT